MKKTPFIFSLLVLTLWLSLGACSQKSAPEFEASEALPAGKASVGTAPYPSFMSPASNLPADKRPAFHAGKALAHQPWVKAPTITDARDGLGPIYNARTCLACHVNGGRSIMPVDGSMELFGAFVRISLPGSDPIQGVVAEPTYGTQLQTQSIALSHQVRQPGLKEKNTEAPPEAYIHIDWQYQDFTYPDHTRISLRKPQLRLEHLGYGALHPQTRFSLRNAPPILGVGLLELIPQAAIDAQADPQDKNGDGISGRVNQVWDFVTQQTVAGRFGLKANRANNLEIVTAAAFAGDVGISNPLFPAQPCTQAQPLCLQTTNGNDENGFELPAQLLTLVTDFSRNLGVPKRNNADAENLLQGRELFYASGCQQCHTPRYVTSTSARLPHLSQQTIWPYTDLLLHDMGPDLADNRTDYQASGSEWRTPPLWGAGLGKKVNGSDNLLHDGRARSVEEAILWHGGEATASRQHFIELPAAKRQLLLQFVESL